MTRDWVVVLNNEHVEFFDDEAKAREHYEHRMKGIGYHSVALYQKVSDFYKTISTGEQAYDRCECGHFLLNHECGDGTEPCKECGCNAFDWDGALTPARGLDENDPESTGSSHGR